MDMEEGVFKLQWTSFSTVGWRGGATIGRRTLDREVTGSIPDRGVAA